MLGTLSGTLSGNLGTLSGTLSEAQKFREVPGDNNLSKQRGSGKGFRLERVEAKSSGQFWELGRVPERVPERFQKHAERVSERVAKCRARVCARFNFSLRCFLWRKEKICLVEIVFVCSSERAMLLFYLVVCFTGCLFSLFV